MNYIKSTLLLTCLGLCLMSCKKEKDNAVKSTELTTTSKKTDSTQVSFADDSTQADDSTKIIKPQYNEYGEEFMPIDLNYVIAYEVYVRSKPDKNSNKVKSLYFGDKVWIDYNSTTENDYSKVFFSKPEMGKPEPKAYYIISSTLVDHYSFKEYETNFSLEPFSELHTGVKKLILNNSYANNTHFALTQNSERANDVIAYGDFDDDGINDVAILIDNVERQSSRLLVLCTNTATKQPYLAYSNSYVDKLKVKSFNKGDRIFMHYDELEPSPIDGIMLTGEGSKGTIIYNKNTQKFEKFGQLRGGY